MCAQEGEDKAATAKDEGPLAKEVKILMAENGGRQAKFEAAEVVVKQVCAARVSTFHFFLLFWPKTPPPPPPQKKYDTPPHSTAGVQRMPQLRRAGGRAPLRPAARGPQALPPPARCARLTPPSIALSLACCGPAGEWMADKHSPTPSSTLPFPPLRAGAYVPFTHSHPALRMHAGVPVKPMLAKAQDSFQEVLKRMQGLHFTMEYKYDGERAQVRRRTSPPSR